MNNNHLKVENNITNESQKSPSSLSRNNSVNNKHTVNKSDSSSSSHITPSSVKHGKNNYKHMKYNNKNLNNNEQVKEQMLSRQRFHSLNEKINHNADNGYPTIKLDRISDEPPNFEKTAKHDKKVNQNAESSSNFQDDSKKKNLIEQIPSISNNYYSKTNENMFSTIKEKLQLNNLMNNFTTEHNTELNGTHLLKKKMLYCIANFSDTLLQVVIRQLIFLNIVF